MRFGFLAITLHNGNVIWFFSILFLPLLRTNLNLSSDKSFLNIVRDNVPKSIRTRTHGTMLLFVRLPSLYIVV